MHKGEMTLLGCGFNGSQKSSIQKKIILSEKGRRENPEILKQQRQLCIIAASWSENKLEESGKGRKR